MKIFAICLLTPLFLTLSCLADTSADLVADKISADRPGLADSSLVVGEGIAQIETGLEADYRTGKKKNSQDYFAPTLLRYGVSSDAELRVEGNVWGRARDYEDSAVETSHGFAPVSVGGKYQLSDGKDEKDTTEAIIVRLAPPSGSDDFRNRHTTADARYAYDTSFGDLGFEVNLGGGIYEDDNGQMFGTMLSAATLSEDVSENMNAFIDGSLQTPDGRHGATAVILDTGFAIAIGLDTQLDISVGTGVAGDDVPDLFVSFGISQRFG